ncbi:C-C chemokine receptor type 3-like [Thalassophryne amazonica]|uniref:C-C chemokine receptor type 3-like n=1 Tax=Thalassophryne amazonica TaxID=390379 RepID=UPI001471F903|nr:C-C chemokine receptor type 3-like [Thalassophryne amazonica]
MTPSTSTDYYDYEYNVTPISPCNTYSINYLGAQLSTLYYVMFVFSLFGNGLVFVIIHRFQKLTSVTNIFLLNLVLSSLIFTSSLPFWGVYQQLSNWIFGTTMCKIVGSVYFLGFYSSVLFLTLLTFDRHVAVVYPLAASQVRRRSYAIVSCAVVWLVSLLACIKPMILYRPFTFLGNTVFCDEYYNIDSINASHLRSAGFYLQLFIFFLFPLAIILYCYIRITIAVVLSKIATKFKTVRLVFIIVLLFFACWTPFNIVLLTYDNVSTCDKVQRMGYALQVTRTIAYVYFCISPIFYTFVGKKFQNYFRLLLVKHFPGLTSFVTVSHTTRSTTTKMATSPVY